MDRRDAIAGGALLVLAAAALVESARLPLGTVHNPGEGFYPALLSAALLVLAAVLLVRALLARTAHAETQHGHVGRVVALLLGLGVYSVLLEPVGYPICTFLLVLTLLTPRTRSEVLPALVLAAIASGASYVLFAVWLKVPLPPGLLGS
jgi:putative tricarboxylic transport membrane protein